MTQPSARRPRLRAETVEVGTLEPATRDALWALFTAAYDEVTRDRFDADLAGKRHIVLCRDADHGAVKGFCTLRRYEGTVQGRSYAAVFTGDTVIDPGYHGQTALHREVARSFVGARLAYPQRPVFWFLISKGFKTYLMLTRNFPDHYPRHDRPTPPWEAAVIADLAGRIDASAYHPAGGVLRFATPHGRLREGVSPIGPEALAHPDVRFFAEQNPGHARGDELCCLGRVNLAFVGHFGGKVLRRALGARAGRGDTSARP